MVHSRNAFLAKPFASSQLLTIEPSAVRNGPFTATPIGDALGTTLVSYIATLIFGLSPQTKALTSAIALNYIGPQFVRRIPQLVAALQTQRATDSPNQPYQTGNTMLGLLPEVAQLAPENRPPSRRRSPRIRSRCARSGARSGMAATG